MLEEFEVIVERSIFAKALSHLYSLVERKNIIDILSHVKLEAADGQINLSTTDSSICMSETIFAEVINGGKITLPVHLLHDIVKKFNDEHIKLSIDHAESGMLSIRSGYSFFQLPFLTAEDFPKIDIGNFSCYFTLPNQIAKKILEKNRYTISQDDKRYHLNGIFLHSVLEQNEMRCTATDGHRLSSTAIPLPQTALNMPEVIIPRKAALELIKIITDSKDDLTVELSQTKARFNIGNITLVSKLIEASFPDYIPLIPYDNELYFNLPSADLSKAIDRATIIMPDKSQAIIMNIEGNCLEIRTGGENHSSGNERLEINSNIDKLYVGLNARYLLDALAAIGNESIVEIKFKDDRSSVLIQSVDDKKTDFVIMPMQD